MYLANNLREACLPKMLCEIAAKPAYAITEKEKSLLDLIKWVYFRWIVRVVAASVWRVLFFAKVCTRKIMHSWAEMSLFRFLKQYYFQDKLKKKTILCLESINKDWTLWNLSNIRNGVVNPCWYCSILLLIIGFFNGRKWFSVKQMLFKVTH